MKKTICLIFIFCSIQCREHYIAQGIRVNTGILVVEGNIIYGDSTRIYISRSSKLDIRETIPESGAAVFVEGDDNSSFQLSTTDSAGYYSAPQLPLDLYKKYRLRIQTSNNKKYLSEFSSIIRTPSIDSISWKRQFGGVEIFINAHSAADNTRYYQWDYVETYEFHSKWRANMYYLLSTNSRGRPHADAIVPYYPNLNPNPEVFTCWKTKSSTSINIGSTANLSENRLHLPMVFYPENSRELAVLYSINTRLHGMSKKAYEFFKVMKKNTETLGSIFDAQPSELIGNISCTDNQDELIMGYVEAVELITKRYFIDNKDLPGWEYPYDECSLEKAEEGATPNDLYYAGLHPIHQSGLFANRRDCVLCTEIGFNVKPDFWPR